MDYRGMSEELCQMHFQYAALFNRIQESVSTRGEDGILIWVDKRNSQTFAIDITRHFELSAGRVANIIKQLERKGLIERRQDSADMRRAEIVLTEEGRMRASELYETMLEEHEKLLRALGADNSGNLMRLAHSMTEIAPGIADRLV